MKVCYSSQVGVKVGNDTSNRFQEIEETVEGPSDISRRCWKHQISL